jgi:hypothetical protein
MEWKAMLRIGLALVVLVVVLLGAAVFLGKSRWQSGTRQRRDRLEASRVPIDPQAFHAGELEGLPAPVQRYFRAVLPEGQPIVAAVNLEHTGTFNLSATGEQWKPFTSTQRVITRRPGFDWDGRISMLPGLPVYVHDSYVAGEGTLHASVLGLVTMAYLHGTREMAEGELLRFLAETAWYPTALLPSQGVRWEAVDARSARATLRDGDLALTLLYRFAEDGLIDTVRAEKRGRSVGTAMIPTPWQGRFWDYAVRDGIRVPMEGEVAWLLPEGAKPYWRGRITRLRYELAQ